MFALTSYICICSRKFKRGSSESCSPSPSSIYYLCRYSIEIREQLKIPLFYFHQFTIITHNHKFITDHNINIIIILCRGCIQQGCGADTILAPALALCSHNCGAAPGSSSQSRERSRSWKSTVAERSVQDKRATGSFGSFFSFFVKNE